MGARQAGGSTGWKFKEMGRQTPTNIFRKNIEKPTARIFHGLKFESTLSALINKTRK